jgi:hypothetical protein
VEEAGLFLDWEGDVLVFVDLDDGNLELMLIALLFELAILGNDVLVVYAPAVGPDLLDEVVEGLVDVEVDPEEEAVAPGTRPAGAVLQEVGEVEALVVLAVLAADGHLDELVHEGVLGTEGVLDDVLVADVEGLVGDDQVPDLLSYKLTSLER